MNLVHGGDFWQQAEWICTLVWATTATVYTVQSRHMHAAHALHDAPTTPSVAAPVTLAPNVKFVKIVEVPATFAEDHGISLAFSAHPARGFAAIFANEPKGTPTGDASNIGAKLTYSATGENPTVCYGIWTNGKRRADIVVGGESRLWLAVIDTRSARRLTLSITTEDAFGHATALQHEPLKSNVTYTVIAELFYRDGLFLDKFSFVLRLS